MMTPYHDGWYKKLCCGAKKCVMFCMLIGSKNMSGAGDEDNMDKTGMELSLDINIEIEHDSVIETRTMLSELKQKDLEFVASFDTN